MKIATRVIEGHEFWLVGTLEIQRNRDGTLAEYVHTLPEDVRPNRHASGPFCRFGLPSAPRSPGVYALFVAGELQYIGECVDLAQRFGSSGYGLISPRNCHSDGQSTNCKLNSRVLAAAKSGEATEVWFYPTEQWKAVELDLISILGPPWNGRRSDGRTREALARTPVEPAPRDVRTSMRGSGEFRTELLRLLAAAERDGATSLRVQSGSLHRLVGGYPGPRHRMPSCCSEMRAAMTPGDRIIEQPPKGAGARLVIEYQLPRAR